MGRWFVGEDHHRDVQRVLPPPAIGDVEQGASDDQCAERLLP